MAEERSAGQILHRGPSSYTDYATDAQLIANQLNNEGFEVSFDGV